MNDTCRSCGADILWTVTPKGKRMPLDPDPVENGNVSLTHDDGRLIATVVKPGDGTHRSHFASCPNAKQHRGHERRPT